MDYLFYTGWMVFFTLVAVSVGHVITPLADGSGIPQMKAFLGGTDVRRFFTWRVMFAKLFGLWCGQVAGLPVGKEVRGWWSVVVGRSSWFVVRGSWFVVRGWKLVSNLWMVC